MLADATGSVHWYFNGLLAQELKNIVLARTPSKSVVAIAGRTASDPDGKPMCRKHKLAAEVAATGAEVFSSICRRPRKQHKKTVYDQCVHYKRCAYIQQFRSADVTIYPHAYLPLNRSRLEGPPADFVVIDEAFFQSCIEITKIPLSMTAHSGLPPPAVRVVKAIARAAVSGANIHEDLNRQGIDFKQMREASLCLKRVGSINPTLTAKQARAVLRVMQVARRLRMLISGVMSTTPNTESQTLSYFPDTQHFELYLKRPVRHIRADLSFKGNACAGNAQPQVLLIDGSADPTIVGQWFCVEPVAPIHVRRNAHVIQCDSTRCSTISLIPARNSNLESRKASAQRIQEVQNLIDHLATQHPKVLVVGPRTIVSRTSARSKPLLRAPPNVEFAHFNAIRGVDGWKDVEAVLIIGRNQPAVGAAEELARCVFKDRWNPLQLTGQWSTEARGYRLAHGQAGTEVVIHPDSRIQAVVEQIRERESEQALDRLRLIHNQSTKFVYLLSNLPLDITVNQLLSWEEITAGTRIERAWRQIGSVMPLEPTWLAQRFPDLWPSESAAKADVHRQLIELQISNVVYLRNLQLNVHQFKQAPSGRMRRGSWSRFLCDHGNLELAAGKLELLLGIPVRVKPLQARPTVQPI